MSNVGDPFMDAGHTVGILAEWRVTYGMKAMFKNMPWYCSVIKTDKNSKLDIAGIDIVLTTIYGIIKFQVKSGRSTGGRCSGYYTSRGINVIRVRNSSSSHLKDKIICSVNKAINELQTNSNLVKQPKLLNINDYLKQQSSKGCRYQ